MRIPKTGHDTRNGAIARTLVLLAPTLLCAALCSAGPTAQEARFQAELERIVEQYGLPGATAAYVLADGTTGVAAAGLADVETGTPMQPESRMLAASIGKTFVGAVVVALEQDGLLDLDDPLSQWLGNRPWFPRLPNANTITLRHLLRHESGLPDHVDDPAFHAAWAERRRDGGDPLSPEDLIAFVLDRPPLFPSGEGWSYSDTGYLLVGLVIEAASGRSYYETLTRRFLAPLELDAITPSDRTELPGLASGYMAPDNGLGLPPVTTTAPGIMAWDPGLEWTGGGLVGDSRDLALWAWTLFGGRALPDPYLETLLLAVPIGDAPASPRYGLGVGVRSDGPLGPTLGHGGWIPGYVSSLRYYPAADIAVAFQVNTDIGMFDASDDISEDMERRLAHIVMAAARDHDRIRINEK